MPFTKNIAFTMLLFICTGHYLWAQKKVKTSYFDRQGSLSSVEGSYYFRETTDTAEFYRSFYSIDSSLYFAGKIIAAKDSSDQKNLYKGICTWYYANGNKKTEYTYNDNGRLDGVCTDYFEDGKPKKILEFENGKQKQDLYVEFGSNGAVAKVFEDDFIGNYNKWMLNTNDTGHVKIKIGGFEMYCKKPQGFVREITPPVASKNYSYEGYINSNYLTDTTKAGLVFEFKDAANYNYFFVSKHKCYIGKVTDGKDEKKINGFLVYSLRGNMVNKLKVIRCKNKLFYCFNDEILFSETQTNNNEKKIGLAIKNQGMVLFDKIILRAYENELTIEPLYAKIKNDNHFIISNKDYGLQSASIGLLLNKQGLISCSAEILKQYHEILIEAYVNDTLKQFTAGLVVKNEASNLAILKINNPANYTLHDIAYSFYEKANLELESTLHSIYFAKSDTNSNKPKIIQGNLKSKARFENLSSYFEVSLRTENIAQGGPVFTSNGELLGIIIAPSIRNNAVATKLSALEQLLFFSNQNFKKPKKPIIPNSMELISKNVVLIKIK